MAGKYNVSIIPGYCKACGICINVCPKDVLSAGKDGKALVSKPEACIGCSICEIHCPDFAITVTGGDKNDK